MAAVLSLSLSGCGAQRLEGQLYGHSVPDPRTAAPPPVPPPPPAPRLVQRGTGRTLFVAALAPLGGDGSAAAPFSSIQAAIHAAQPGETVHVGPGIYAGTIQTERPGRAGQPIRIEGDRASLVEQPRAGNSTDYVVVIGHDYQVFTGFDVAGGDTTLRLFHASNVLVTSNHIHHARGECVRVKFFSSHNEISSNGVEDCGLRNFRVAADKKNGEGIYIGTAPEQVDDNPRNVADQSNANHVHDNNVRPHAECVDVKEGARDNYVERNTCHDTKDPEGSGFDSRGTGTIFVNNISMNNAGAGIRLGGDTAADGGDSIVRGNRLIGNAGYGVNIQAGGPQKLICGNTLENNLKGPSNAAGVDPTSPCPV